MNEEFCCLTKYNTTHLHIYTSSQTFVNVFKITSRLFIFCIIDRGKILKNWNAKVIPGNLTLSDVFAHFCNDEIDGGSEIDSKNSRCKVIFVSFLVYVPSLYVSEFHRKGTEHSFIQFMTDQDTGGAIQAPGRADLFMGVGPTAGIRAGNQYAEGQLYYLFLKPNIIASVKD